MKRSSSPRRTVALALLALAAAGPARAQAPPGPAGPHERALALAAEERWAEAFDAWESGWDSLDFRDAYDPRLGVAYLEHAVEQSAWGRYGTATAMYLWGFTAPDTARFGDDIRAEVARILPLLDGEARRAWDDRLRAGRLRELSLDVKRFWIERDPTPDTDVNERLVEHWERILEARRRFRNGTYSPYGTDDRGVVWVRYGPPDKSDAGTLGARDDELRIWVRDREQREALRRYDTYPSYEVWRYEGLDARGPRYFLFGQRDGSGRFERVDGVRDLINPSAMGPLSRRSTPGGVKASYFLQLFYYAELSGFGGPFGDRFAELDRLWSRSQSRAVTLGGTTTVPPEALLESADLRFHQEDRDLAARPDPPVATALDGNEGMAVAAWAFRTLREGQPRLTLVALSSPWMAADDADDAGRRAAGGDRGRVAHTLVVRDAGLEEVGRVGSPATSPGGDVSVFELRHVPEPLHFTVVARTVGGASPYPGRMHLRPAPPLRAHPDSLEVSDVVVGGLPWEGTASVVPFPVMPAGAVWAGDPLRVYLEAYHLADAGDGRHPWAVTFRVLPVDGEGRPAGGAAPVRLGLELEAEEADVRRTFDVDLGELPLGDYLLDVAVRDRVSGLERRRAARFAIVGREP